MSFEELQPNITDLADGSLAGPEWDQWLSLHPAEAAEIEVARRVRQLMAQLARAEIAVPQDFELRLMARIREDRTLLDLLDLFFADVSGMLIELINLLLGVLPVPQPQQPVAP
jgi:hypothetical protein